jgi:peptidoglycan pentaglycine glycine transferase (the first glycine)
MEIRQLTSGQDLTIYDQWVKTHPYGTLWQSLEWKGYQEALGRETRIYAAVEGSQIVATALIIIDRTSFGLSTWDIPRGPLGETPELLLKTILRDAKKDRCLSLYLSPIEPLKIKSRKLKTSSRHEQPEATRVLDLTLNYEDILSQMLPKGRYNIKVAAKNGVFVTQSTDTELYVKLAKKTAARDRFTTASSHQYEKFLGNLPGSFLLLAYNGDQVIAGLIGVKWNGTGIYYYGASDYEHRAMMAPYALQAEAINICRNSGCTRYDLLGVAPPVKRDERREMRDENNSDSRVSSLVSHDPSHPWAGISSFKEKFGGELITYPPEKQITLRRVAKGMLKVKRKLFG